MDIAFGPVPSRRLGRSLGINNIPPKICTYACLYCQLGRTIKMQIERQAFYAVEETVSAARAKVAETRSSYEAIDYLTIVPDGEPTLDIHLGKEISELGKLEIPIAVISNASLIWRADVRNALLGADWVSLKVDAVRDSAWRKINRPYGSLDLEAILDGIRAFAGTYKGFLATETMLVDGINDNEPELRQTAQFLGEIQPSASYIAIPTRPPAEKWVLPAQEAQIHQAYQFFVEQLERVELLLGYEGNAFASSGNAEEDLLSITAVHPMRQDAVEELLLKTGSDWSLVEGLIEKDKLIELSYEGRHFYLRRIPNTRDHESR
jgi:wyosine [tRNA(Phe)-imidazoG37] synthetase (radical SAM superfamily)